MKYMLIGLILVLAGVLWFLPGREGLANPPGCPTAGQGITSVGQSGGQNIRLYTQTECTGIGGNWIGNGLKSWGMKTDLVGECYGVPGGQNVSFCNQSSPPSAGASTAAGVTPPVPLNPPKLDGDWTVGGTSTTAKIVQSGNSWTLTPSSAASGWSLVTGTFTSDRGGNLVYTTPSGPLNMTFNVDTDGKMITGSNGGTFARVPAPPPPAPVTPPPTPPAPPAPSTNETLMGTLISLLQQDINTRKSSLLNTANNPNVPVGSLLTQTTVVPNGTIPGPSTASMTMSRGPYDEVPKSSLVPCTCPTYSMSCPVHSGSQPCSTTPGEAGDTISALSKAQDQYDIMRPFNNSERDVPGFLNTFSAFG